MQIFHILLISSSFYVIFIRKLYVNSIIDASAIIINLYINVISRNITCFSSPYSHLILKRHESIQNNF